MIIAAIAVLSITREASAGDYFPLTQGTKWSYSVMGDVTGSYTLEVGPPEAVNELPLSPVLVRVGTKVQQKVFYAVSETEVTVLGTNPKKLYPTPHPVFQIGPKEVKWEFTGASPYEDDPGAGIVIKGQSKPVGQRDVFGVKRDCLEVKTENVIGLTKEASTLIKRTSIYAKGVGLIEMQEISQAGRKKLNQVVKLTKFEPAEVSSR